MIKVCLLSLCVFLLSVFLGVAVAQEKVEEKPQAPPAEKPPAEQPSAKGIQWEATYDTAVKKAKEVKKPLLIYIYEPGKKLCEAMESNVFGAPDVIRYAENFVCYKEEAKKGQGATAKFRVPAVPFVVIVSSDDEKAISRILDCLQWQQFLGKLRAIFDSIALEKELKQKLSQSQDDLEANFKLAELWVIRGNTDQAILFYGKVVRLDQKNEKGFMIDAALKLAELNLEKGRPDEARKQFKKVLEVDPENKKGTKEVCALSEAKILVQFEDKYDEAITALTNFISTYPQSKFLADAHYLLGFACWKKNDYDNAITNWEIILSKFPEHELADKTKVHVEIAKQERDKKKTK